jgi:Mrp family chromosome partitioning ATPase
MSDGGPPLGRVITFYSYKGGTGRSMALANVAFVLACSGRRVLAIDWDLEAPGLHRYFRPFLIDEEVTASEGLMDLVDHYANEAIRPLADHETPDPDWYVPYADFSNYIVSVNFPHFRSGGKIDFLPAGRQGDHYALAVSSFNWQNFYDRLGGGGFIEAVRQRARAHYDYVLIDSRTGVSDTAGICSVQLPETLVVCFTYNNQSIKGASAVARSALAMRERLVEEKLQLQRSGKTRSASLAREESLQPYRIFPVAMRVDSGESDRLAIRQAFAQRVFADLVGHIGAENLGEYWKAVEVPQTSFYSYEEVLAPFKDDPQDPKSILAAFLRLTRYVSDRDVTDFHLPISPQQRQAFLDKFAETPLTVSKQALSESQQETPEQELARTAEAALALLPEAERRIAPRVLLRLVRVEPVDGGGGYAARRAPLDEFDEQEQHVIRHFVAQGVLSLFSNVQAQPSSTGAGATAVVVRHERLLRSWRTLAGWIEQDREFLLWRQRLRTYLADWERNGRDPGTLLSGRVLSEADLMAQRRRDDLTRKEAEYIEESRKASREPAPVPVAQRYEPVQRLPSPETTAAPIDAKAPAGRRAAIWALAAAVAIVAAGTLVWMRTRAAPPEPTTSQVEAGVTGVKVPRLVGLSSSDARTALDAAGLKATMTAENSSQEAAFLEGVVVAQMPNDDAAIAAGGVVRLTVATRTATTPAVTGLTLTAALKALGEQRLNLGNTESRFVPDAKVDTIIAQKPEPGTRVAASTPVDVVVARAPRLSDVQIGIYYLDADEGSKALASRLTAFLRRAGNKASPEARPAQFFTGRRAPAGHEIRYGSPAERQMADELRRLLQTSDFPPFVPTLVRNASEGFISLFIPPPAYDAPVQQAPRPKAR